MTLDAIANDYENFEMILHEVRKWSLEDGVPVPSDDEVASALISLVEDGLAQAYSVAPSPDGPKVIPISRAMIGDPYNYFYVTSQGIREVKARLSDSGPE